MGYDLMSPRSLQARQRPREERCRRSRDEHCLRTRDDRGCGRKCPIVLINSLAQVIEKEERRRFGRDVDVSSSRWNQWPSGHT
jgi:hypothetical protein